MDQIYNYTLSTKLIIDFNQTDLTNILWIKIKLQHSKNTLKIDQIKFPTFTRNIEKINRTLYLLRCLHLWINIRWYECY